VEGGGGGGERTFVGLVGGKFVNLEVKEDLVWEILNWLILVF